MLQNVASQSVSESQVALMLILFHVGLRTMIVFNAVNNVFDNTLLIHVHNGYTKMHSSLFSPILLYSRSWQVYLYIFSSYLIV